jgi:hypothetical protein
LVADGLRLFLVDFRGQQIADNVRRVMLAFDRRADDLVIGGPHAVELQIRNDVQDLGSFHQMGLLRLSWREQSTMGAWFSRSASGVKMVTGGAGSRCRARMLMTTPAE